MTIVKVYLDDPVPQRYYGSVEELNALSTSGLNTGDQFFAYNSYLLYHYATGYGWLLWEKMTVS